MIKYSVKTKLDREDVLQKAKAYFGDELGLEIEEKVACCLNFNVPNSVGYVSVRLTSEENEPVKVELETREFKYQVEQFMRQIS
jgi:hypothetical protein